MEGEHSKTVTRFSLQLQHVQFSGFGRMTYRLMCRSADGPSYQAYNLPLHDIWAPWDPLPFLDKGEQWIAP